MRTVLTKLNIPDKFTIGGIIENTSAKLILERTTQGRIEGGRIEMDLKCTVDIEGVKVEYKSSISHTLTTKEMDELMLKFSK
jgi:hypothetical protein